MAPASKLTPELTATMADYLRRGAHIDDACAIAGIDRSTYYRWTERAQAGDEACQTFARAVEAARAEATMKCLEVILTAAEAGKWQAAAWWLERSHPDRYGNRVNVAGPNGGPVELDADHEDKVRQMLDAYLAWAQAGKPGGIPPWESEA